MSLKELNKLVFKKKIIQKGIPFRQCLNFSLWKWKFDELYISNGENTFVIKEVVKNEAWIVYDKDERGRIKEISMYRDLSEAESAFLTCLEKYEIIHNFID